MIAPHPRRAVWSRPATWVTAVAVVVGGARIATLLRGTFRDFPAATITAVVLCVLYVVPFLLLLRVIEHSRRPSPLAQVAAFAWGGLVATSAAIAGGTALENIIAKRSSPQVAALWGPAISGATIEELLKALGLVMIVLMAPRRLGCVMDGFVVGALVGLGFQTVENVVFALGALARQVGTDRVGPVVETFALRGIAGGLWSHALFTALAGTGVAYAVVRRDRGRTRRVVVASALLAAAAALHFFLNSPLLAGLGPLLGGGVGGALAALVVRTLPAIVVAIVLVVSERRRQGR